MSNAAGSAGEHSYPYMLDGSLICGEHPASGPLGSLQTELEWYPIDTMNRLLQSAGTPDEAAPIDVEFKTTLHDRGVDRIASCDDARAFQQVKTDLLIAQLGAAPASSDPSDARASDPFVDKIVSGQPFDYPDTVAIWVDPQHWTYGCTGQLIGPFAMITAGHCLPPSFRSGAFAEIASWIGTNASNAVCISPQGCSSGVATAYVAAHPNYTGPGDQFDQAVVIVNPGWLPPANTSARWTTFAFDGAAAVLARSSAHPLMIAGYGVTGPNSNDPGYGRVGNNYQTVFHTSTNSFTILRKTAATASTCEGDSGGGANTFITFGNIPSAMFTLGIFSGWGFQQEAGRCTKVNGEAFYAAPNGAWISSLVNFFGGSCATTAFSGFSAVKCF